MAKVEEKKSGKKIIVLEPGESALVFANDGIYQLLSKTFKSVLSEAQKTQGQSILQAFDNCKPEEASKVVNNFVLVQVVGLLSEIYEDLKLKK
jgi:TRAP-type mannitol/chloroaromatic compound transport system substrate-binding protein